MTDSEDAYAVTAEYYTLMTRDFRAAQRAALQPGLALADPAAGPILDLGAGTGESTLDVLALRPDAEVIAVEPARAMRTVLRNRLADRPELDGRVTVVAGELRDAELPPQLGGVVMMNVLGHFHRAARAELFQEFAARLRPGLPVVLSLQAPSAPAVIAPTLGTSLQMGRTRYEGWMEAVPSGCETVHWTMRYRTLRDDCVVDEQVAEYEFHHFPIDQLASEADAAGFDVRPGDGEVHALLRR